MQAMKFFAMTPGTRSFEEFEGEVNGWLRNLSPNWRVVQRETRVSRQIVITIWLEEV